MRRDLPRDVMQCITIAWIDGNMSARITPASPAENGTATRPVDSSAERHPTVPLCGGQNVSVSLAQVECAVVHPALTA